MSPRRNTSAIRRFLGLNGRPTIKTSSDRFRLRVEQLEAREVPASLLSIQGILDAYEGGNAGVMTITREGDLDTSLSVEVATSGIAIGGSDFMAPLTIPFAPNQVTANVQVFAFDDMTQESYETITYTLVAGSGYTVGTPNSATITLYDNDTPSTVTIVGMANVQEDSSPGLFQVNRTGALHQQITVWLMASGTAMLNDYQSPMSVTFAPWETEQFVIVTDLSDALVEGTETITLGVMSIGPGFVAGTPSTATIDLYDDEVAPPTLSVSVVPTVMVQSYDGTFGVNDPLFRLLRDDEPTNSLTVSYVLRSRTDPDPSAAPVHRYTRTAVFNLGYDAVDIYVTPSDLGSPTQAWYVTLDVLPTAGVNTDPSSSGSVTVWPYVAPNAFTIESVTGATAGSSPGQVLISRLDASSPLTINYSVDPSSTAIAGEDYAALSGVLSFAAGQQQAAITVDASAFPNVANKAVVINLASPVAGFRFPAQPLVPIRQPMPANPPPNQNPYFTNAAGQQVNSYDIVVGYGTKATTLVLKSRALDPDDVLLTYFINPVSFERRFRIGADGEVRVSTDLALNQAPLSFQIVVADGRGGFGFATVNVTFAPLVLIGGDLYGVRSQIGLLGAGKVDNIHLTFFRTAPLQFAGGLPVLPELPVEFSIDWLGVSTNNANGTADVTNETQLVKWAGTGNYKVVIGQNRVMGVIDIAINHTHPVAVAERARWFKATVVDRPEYVSNKLHWGQALPLASPEVEHVGQGRARAYILPAVTMYAGANNQFQGSKFGADGGNAKVHDNDIHQGVLGDCGPLSALQAMTRNEGKLTAIGVLLPEGRVRFRFEPVGSLQADTYDFDATLTRGINQASLSWDYDDGTAGTGIAKYEIWVQMFERAYDHHRRVKLQRGIGAGGEAYEFLDQVAGITTTPRVPLILLPVNTLKQLVTGAIERREPVILSTVANTDGTLADRLFGEPRPPNNPNHPGQLKINYNHCFTIMAVAGDLVAIRNPHGVVYLMTFGQLSTYFDYIYAGEEAF